MKIAFVAVKGIPIGGGIEKLTEEIGARLVKKGHEVIVYTSRDYGTKDCEYNGMTIKTVSSINTKSLHKLSICFNATLDVLKNRDVDIVHVHAIGPSLFSIFPRMVGIPTVVQTHGIEWQRDKWGFAGRTFLRLSDYTAVYFPNATTAVSKVQKTYFEEQYGCGVEYIPTGVNKVEYRKPDRILEMGIEKDKYILFAARLVEEKGPHFLIEAFKNIDTDMKLVVAGDAAHAEGYKASLKQMAGNDDRVLFPGFVTGRLLEELFSNAYVFCLPSTLEGLPIALLEAMSYGNCCLASDIPENLEAIEDFGYTFKNREIGDLRKKLEYLIENPDKVRDKKKAAREHVLNNYSWDTIADQMEELYFSIVGR
ncbi:MAG: glycosyltransferase family 4 protein [Deltaproteobacteria bacterium]|uniref:glycosyltransferase family 4 protein n=1 Tax=Desulfobacula sp. TaxID=2593537 RepID=UPI00199B7322|nr:glycosyltransferase family 4 protein [Candidatus Desulfobacula maris]MBL6992408.1 glycosyltransferase family 4 protein [Desulfobacula sp.]